MQCWVVRFKPLCANRAGRAAVARHGHPPFVDASCRREPDFEAVPPSISALCRERFFAPRLKRDDVAVYLTKVGRYGGSDVWGYRVVGVLQVRHRFPTHGAAAAWYRERGVALPSNCLVPGNPPLAADHTEGPNADVIVWDAGYQDRVQQYPMFLITKSLFVELRKPPVLTPRQVVDALGEIPPRTPVPYGQERVEHLLALAGIALEFQPLVDESLGEACAVEAVEQRTGTLPPSRAIPSKPPRPGRCGPPEPPVTKIPKRVC